ncbi:MAG: metal ABC transporter ATP-binding protein [Thermoleophilia bacterium]|nr:metal ABC transporter ATP-binding protein [Thermoleophilia bacterium]
MIEALDLAIGYDGRPVLSEVRFEAWYGSRIGLLGPNGGGKTTLFRALLGELKPLSGSLTVEGASATVPQSDRSRLDYPVTCLDVATMGALARLRWWQRPTRGDRAKAAEALGTVGMGDRADDSFGDLSGGQRQRVLIARALTAEADLLLLDEPYTGLDSKSAKRLDRLIEELAGDGRTVMIATHDVEQAQGWDRVLCLNRTQIAFGPPDDVLDRKVLEATYGGHIVEIPGEPGHGVLPPHHHDHEDPVHRDPAHGELP